MHSSDFEMKKIVFDSIQS